MTSLYRFYAFLATVAALVTMFIAASVLAYNDRSVEAIGISGALTGLIALLGTLAGGKPQGDGETIQIKQPAGEPVPVEETS